jgi:hypothetical protein
MPNKKQWLKAEWPRGYANLTHHAVTTVKIIHHWRGEILAEREGHEKRVFARIWPAKDLGSYLLVAARVGLGNSTHSFTSVDIRNWIGMTTNDNIF